MRTELTTFFHEGDEFLVEGDGWVLKYRIVDGTPTSALSSSAKDAKEKTDE